MSRKLSSLAQRRSLCGVGSLIVVFLLWSIAITTSPQPGVTVLFEPIATSSTTKTHVSKALQGSFVEPGIIKHNVAVIIEDRPLEAIVPLLLHFSSVLGLDWPIVLFTSQNIIPESPAFHRAINERRIAVAFLPPGVHVWDEQDLEILLTSTWFWESLAPAEYVFMFQADSIVCANSLLTLSDFLEYDFIGAPIHGSGQMSGGLGGGLSLRKRTMMLDILRSYKRGAINNHRHKDQAPLIDFDEQSFYHRMKKLHNNKNRQPGAKLPSVEVAMAFAVERIWYDKPFSFHNLGDWGAEKVAEVNKWCPEQSFVRRDTPNTGSSKEIYAFG